MQFYRILEDHFQQKDRGVKMCHVTWLPMDTFLSLDLSYKAYHTKVSEYSL